MKEIAQAHHQDETVVDATPVSVNSTPTPPPTPGLLGSTASFLGRRGCDAVAESE